MAKGYLFLIGGGSDSTLIFNKMFELAGGITNARLAIIPSASGNVGTTMKSYEDYFTQELGLPAENIWSVPLAIDDDPDTLEVDESTWKDNAYNKDIAYKISQYNIIFFVGGDQRKYVHALRKNNIESPLLHAIENVYANGGIIAGTSAGTNILCKTSIAGGRSEEALLNRVTFKNEDDDGSKLLIIEGLGLTENIVFDTHHENRGRLGRLSDAVVLTNNRYGIGISEQTAVILNPDNTIEVLGYGNTLLVDMENVKKINKPRKQLHVRGVNVTLLTHGDKFNLDTKEFTPNPKKDSIINIPYFDANDYHISLNVFKQYETSQILVNYMLDNEAKDVIALMDYDQVFAHGDTSAFMHFVETKQTSAWFCKLNLEETTEPISSYSGANILLDVIPVTYEKDGWRRKNFNVVLFGIENHLQVVVYDNVSTNPVCDAKIQVYDTNEKLIYKKGSDRYGRMHVCRSLTPGEEYTVKVTYDGEEKVSTFTFNTDMEGLCLN